MPNDGPMMELPEILNRDESDVVNHPSHYGGDGPHEVIKVLENWLSPDELRGFLKGNVLKYLARAAKKGSSIDDYAKAAWYADRLINFERKTNFRKQT